jgi:hypothetical protein
MKYEYDDFDDRCRDCKRLVTPTHTPSGTPDWQWYIVYPDVWAAAGLKFTDGCLCIPCLEQRLGRVLTAADFPPAPINDPDAHPNTPYLHALKQAVAELHPEGDWLKRNRRAEVVPLAPRFWRQRDAALEAIATLQHWLRLP